MKTLIISLILLFNGLPCWADNKTIALTIDDLPFVGSANNKEGNLKREHDRFTAILNTLITHNIPATGFIIANSIEKGQWELLDAFKAHGFALGNHTYSHPSLNSTSAERYIADIEHADKILASIMTTPKYFRYPYLAESSGQKREQVHQYLADNHYIIAPVTIDSKDYQFNAQFLAISWRQRDAYLGRMKERYLSYIWNQTLRAEARASKENKAAASQILLIHANLLNSHLLGDVIDMYQKNGYTFVTLAEALKSPAAPAQEIEIKPLSEQISALGVGYFTESL